MARPVTLTIDLDELTDLIAGIVESKIREHSSVPNVSTVRILNLDPGSIARDAANQAATVLASYEPE